MVPPDDPSYRPTVVGTTCFLSGVDRERASIVLEQLAASESPMRVAQLRALGGAMARVPADATAFAHRDPGVVVVLAALYDGEADHAAQQAWLDRCVEAVSDGTPGAYANFLHYEGEGRVRDAYPGATWDRLAAVKRRVDPTNLFRRNHNVPPA